MGRRRSVQGYALSYVDNSPLREAFERSGLTTYELARRLGYRRRRTDNYRVGPDSSTVRRTLGLKNGTEGKPQRFVRQKTALRYAKALNLDPWEIGL